MPDLERGTPSTRPTGRRRWRVARLGALLPAAVVGVLVVEGVVAGSRDFLVQPGFVVDETVGPDGGRPIRMWVLGDSTAAGVGAADEGRSLPVQVARRVAAATQRPVEVTGLGVSGARTADVAAQAARLPGRGVDVVVVAIGSNDVIHATPWWQMDDRTRRMLAAIRSRTRAPVVVAGIPRFAGVDALPQPLRGIVDRYAAVLRTRQRAAVQAADGATFTDIASQASPRFIGVPDAMASDDFHPAGVGYGFWADALAPHVVVAVGSPGTAG